jgi:hypothetical protein
LNLQAIQLGRSLFNWGQQKEKYSFSLRPPCPVRYFGNTVAHNVYSLPDEEKCAGTIYCI